MLAACWRRNSVQVASTRFGAGSIPAFEDRPDDAGCELDPEADELALDPPVAPARVLARQPHPELAHLDGCVRATGTAMRIRPTARDQFAVPTQQRPRTDEQRPLSGLPWQQAAKCRQQRPIGLRQLRTSDLTVQHPQLMAEQQNLDLLLALGATAEHN
jgi:hypothetical protein